ncbi:MAG: GNAT family N-acetyltransferase [Nocardiopsaceae bacterium]|jgi:predicted acetyltransferase|nr:GNAT family N-acetyltransferase [Nocardiopsaceae bacterium]
MLRLRPPRPDEEAPFRRAYEQMASEGFPFAFELQPDTPWPDYLHRLSDWQKGASLPDGWVPDSFLVADVEGQIVGRVSIRHQLTDFLRNEGGHIGYCVLPEYRRRGYATEILRQALIVARSVGVDRVLITCDDDNVGSIKVIEACGGKLDSVRPASGSARALRRYWVD